MKKVVLAYSGGLDTSIAVSWLKDRGFDVIAYVADVGQNLDRKKLTKKAKNSGVSKIVIDDLKKEFIDAYIIPALKANAVYEGKYYLATALSRPLIAKGLIDLAKKEKAGYAGHGCTAKGNDQVRFELAFYSLAPEIKVVAPAREWDFKSREKQVDFALKHKIPVDATKKSPYSIDENLWGVSIECGVLEDLENTLPEDAYVMTTSGKKAPSKEEKVEIEFKRGIPVGLNGKKMELIKIIEILNKIGGKHGVGRSDMIENRSIGIKSREVYEAPAAAILTYAHKELESLVLDKETAHYKSLLEQKYADLIYNGYWFTPFKEALDAFINKTQELVSGEVILKLYKGSVISSSRKSPHSLYSKNLATYGKDDTFDKTASNGFIKILSLPYRLAGKRKK